MYVTTIDIVYITIDGGHIKIANQCLVYVFFNRQSTYLWVQTVLLFSQTCIFIRMRHTSYMGFSIKTKNVTFLYIYDVHSPNNSRLDDFADRIYHIEFQIKDTTDTDRSASYLDLHIDIDSEGKLRTKLYSKRDNFKFSICM